MSQDQYADSDGKFYRKDYKNGDHINQGVIFGTIRKLDTRNQQATAPGFISGLLQNGVRVNEGDVICTIDPQIISTPPLAV